MHSLFTAVFERAGTVERELAFVIDDADELLGAVSTARTLETAVGHRRPRDRSLDFLTGRVASFR